MEQHPIPRQITTFEFKLIGFMTLKQFLYLIISAPIAFIIYMLFPIPIINILLAICAGIVGIVFAFVPFNDRPIDVLLRNFWKRINSPTQYFFRKDNPPIALLQNLFYVNDPHRVMAHIESQKMLSAYLATTKQTLIANQKKKVVQQVVQAPISSLRVNPPKKKTGIFHLPSFSTKELSTPVTTTQEKRPFFIGIVKNNKQIPLPGILIYIKDKTNQPVRLLKSNPHGVFATYSILPPDEYTFEMKDTNNLYFFDTMKIKVSERNDRPIEFYSKEML